MPDLCRTALLLCDLQNDFLSPEGAYGRAGLGNTELAALPARVKPLAESLRASGGYTISTHFTLVPGRGGEPLIAPDLRKLRPFLAKGDFAPGSFGHALVDALAPADFAVEKIAYSAFYMTRLEWLLRKLGIEKLYVSGIVTNGGVSSTVRDAHMRDFETVVLADGCGAFSSELHQTALAALGSLCKVESIAEAMAEIGARASGSR